MQMSPNDNQQKKKINNGIISANVTSSTPAVGNTVATTQAASAGQKVNVPSPSEYIPSSNSITNNSVNQNSFPAKAMKQAGIAGINEARTDQKVEALGAAYEKYQNKNNTPLTTWQQYQKDTAGVDPNNFDYLGLWKSKYSGMPVTEDLKRIANDVRSNRNEKGADDIHQNDLYAYANQLIAPQYTDSVQKYIDTANARYAQNRDRNTEIANKYYQQNADVMNAEKAKALEQAYMDHIYGTRKTAERLSALGLGGGVNNDPTSGYGETSMAMLRANRDNNVADLNSQYGQNLAKLMLERDADIVGFENAYNEYLASGDDKMINAIGNEAQMQNQVNIANQNNNTTIRGQNIDQQHHKDEMAYKEKEYALMEKEFEEAIRTNNLNLALEIWKQMEETKYKYDALASGEEQAGLDREARNYSSSSGSSSSGGSSSDGNYYDVYDDTPIKSDEVNADNDFNRFLNIIRETAINKGNDAAYDELLAMQDTNGLSYQFVDNIAKQLGLI